MSRDCDKLYSVGKFCTSLSRGIALDDGQQIARTIPHVLKICDYHFREYLKI